MGFTRQKILFNDLRKANEVGPEEAVPFTNVIRLLEHEDRPSRVISQLAEGISWRHEGYVYRYADNSRENDGEEFAKSEFVHKRAAWIGIDGKVHFEFVPNMAVEKIFFTGKLTQG